jgi:hypothetical protein
MPDIAPLPPQVAGAFRMAFSGPCGLRADAGGMPGGGGCGAGSWCAGQEGGIPPSSTKCMASTKARTTGSRRRSSLRPLAVFARMPEVCRVVVVVERGVGVQAKRVGSHPLLQSVWQVPKRARPEAAAARFGLWPFLPGRAAQGKYTAKRAGKCIVKYAVAGAFRPREG